MNVESREEKNRIKLLIISIVLFICILCAEYIVYNAYPYTVHKKEYQKTIMAKDIKDYQGYSSENGILKPDSDNSRIVIGDCGDILSKVTVNFKEAFKEDTDVSLYYSKKSNGRGESYCRKLAYSGTDKIEFNFKAKKYRYISLKIYGDFSLESVDMNLNKETNIYKNEKNILFVSLVIDILLLGIFAVINKNTLTAMLEKGDKKSTGKIDHSIDKSKFNIEKAFVVWALIGGLMMSILIPSAQIPDEYTHVKMMQDELGLKGYAEEINDKYLTAIDSGKIMTRNGEKQNLKLYFEKSKERFSEDLHITIRPSVKMVRHFAADIGFLLCLLIKLPIFWCLQISEIFALIFYLISGYYAVKLMPVKKEFMAVIMLLPMSLQQAGSLNYDATLIPVCCLFIAYVVNFLYSEKKIGWKNIVFMIILLVVMGITKPPYALLVFMLFMIPARQYELKIKDFDAAKTAYRFRWGILIAALLAGITGTYILRNNAYVAMVLASIIKLTKYILIMLRTIKSSFTFYGISAIGCFGWLESHVSIWYVAVTIILCIVLTQVDDKKEKKFNKIRSIICIVSFLIVFNLIFISMESWTVHLNDWSVESALAGWLQCLDKINIIEGVQGRYMIPIIPVIGMLIPAVKKIGKEKAYLLINAYAVISILHVGVVLVNRYWIGAVV